MKSLKILLAGGIIVAITVLLVRLSNVGSDIELIASPKGPYYADLPINVDFTVKNRGSKDAYVLSVGHGSRAIRTGYMLASDGKPVPHSMGSRMGWQRIMRLRAGGKWTGSVNVSSWMAPTNGVTGDEFLPGDYSVSLYYRYGTNRNDAVSSKNVIIHIVEPDNALKEKRELFRRVSNGFNHAIPQVISEDLKQENPSDCYTTAALSLYANWLEFENRHDEALEVYKKLLDAGDAGNKVSIKSSMAYIYLALKRREDARRILEEIKRESDEAFWLLWTLNKKKGTPTVDEE